MRRLLPLLVFFPLALQADELLPSTELACIGPRFGDRSPVPATASVDPESRLPDLNLPFDPIQGVSLFGQYGSADADICSVEYQVGLGVSAIGLQPGRDSDSTGVYCSWARTTRAPGSTINPDECCLDLYSRLQVTPFPSLKPDFQWIYHPGGLAAPSNAQIIALRATIIL